MLNGPNDLSGNGPRPAGSKAAEAPPCQRRTSHNAVGSSGGEFQRHERSAVASADRTLPDPPARGSTCRNDIEHDRLVAPDHRDTRPMQCPGEEGVLAAGGPEIRIELQPERTDHPKIEQQIVGHRHIESRAGRHPSPSEEAASRDPLIRIGFEFGDDRALDDVAAVFLPTRHQQLQPSIGRSLVIVDEYQQVETDAGCESAVPRCGDAGGGFLLVSERNLVGMFRTDGFDDGESAPGGIIVDDEDLDLELVRVDAASLRQEHRQQCGQVVRSAIGEHPDHQTFWCGHGLLIMIDFISRRA
nr:hypothetical protein [Microlunatus soli]